MELEVKTEFRDKYTGKVYKVGEILKVTKKRGDELLKSPYIVVTKKELEQKTEQN